MYADKPLYIPPAESPVTRQIEKISESTSRKEVDINVNGSGSIKVTGGMSKDEVLEVMWDYFKPVLASIIEQENLEEGDESYEY